MRNLENYSHQEKSNENLGCYCAQNAERGPLPWDGCNKSIVKLSVDHHRVERSQNASKKLNRRIGDCLLPLHATDKPHAESDCGIEMAAGEVAECKYNCHKREANGKWSLTRIRHHHAADDADKQECACAGIMARRDK